MDSLVARLRSLSESFKDILTSPQFGSEYEMISTELAVEWLRIQLWGESVGRYLDGARRLQQSLLRRPEVEKTITQPVNTIAYVLAEIEVVRRKYERRLHLEPITQISNDDGDKAPPNYQHFHTMPRFTSGSIRQRMRDNQRQKSFFEIAKWALCDSKRFDEKVKRLRTSVDGLEKISHAAGMTTTAASAPPVQASTVLEESESPPPYAFEAPTARPPSRHDENWPLASSPAPPAPAIPASDNPDLPPLEDSKLAAHYIVLKTFLGPILTKSVHRQPKARDKLGNLSDIQFQELRTDVYDELVRRQESQPVLPFLPPSPRYHPKRNQAREKLSTLSHFRFCDLTSDLVFELDRRFPQLRVRATEGRECLSVLQCPGTRRYGCALHNDPVPPSLQYRLRPRIVTGAPVLAMSTLTSSSTQTVDVPAQPRGTSAEIYKSFRVSKDDPTTKVLPVVLKKYNISAPAEDYPLLIVYDDIERVLGPDEKPPMIVKHFQKSGKRPMFILWKKEQIAVEQAASLTEGLW